MDGPVELSKPVLPSVFNVAVVTCGSCKRLLAGDIYQCQNHHLQCATCRSNGVKCLCSMSSVGYERNLCLERLIGSFYVPCVNRRLGCNEIVSLSSSRNNSHELSCSFNQFNCVVCDMRVMQRQYANHLCSVHGCAFVRVQGPDSPFTEHRLLMNKPAVTVLEAGEFLLLLHYETDGQQQQSGGRIFVTLVGAVGLEKGLAMEVMVVKGEECLVMKSTMSSIAINYRDPASLNYLSLPPKMADRNGQFTMKLRRTRNLSSEELAA